MNLTLEMSSDFLRLDNFLILGKAILAVMGWPCQEVAAKTVLGGLYIQVREIGPTMVSFFPCII